MKNPLSRGTLSETLMVRDLGPGLLRPLGTILTGPFFSRGPGSLWFCGVHCKAKAVTTRCFLKPLATASYRRLARCYIVRYTLKIRRATYQGLWRCLMGGKYVPPLVGSGDGKSENNQGFWSWKEMKLPVTGGVT